MTPEQWIEAQNKLVGRARRDLRRFWGTLPLPQDPVGARRRLEAYWPTLIQEYGEVAVTLAADRFETETGLRAQLADPVPEDEANARLRWGVGPLFGGDGPLAALALLDLLLDELVKQPGRDTYVDSAAANGARVARIPTGKETCAFCLMLASRGFDYPSRETAGEVKTFHGDCDCRVAVEGENTGDYDPKALYEQYLEADGKTTSETLQNMRKNLGIN